MTEPLRLSIGTQATLACLWEATAAKPGNVHRGADFEDLSYLDFAMSAAAIGPILDRAGPTHFGQLLHQCVLATRATVGTNTNLGTLLLLVPLAKAAGSTIGELAASAAAVVESTTPNDTQLVYQAINAAKPGGMGTTAEADLAGPAPAMNVKQVMALAADRDTIARELSTGFECTVAVASRIQQSYERGVPLGEAIVDAAVWQLAEVPDSLVARKLGDAAARDVSHRAAAVLSRQRDSWQDYWQACGEFDFWLRADGHRRNPGTTADIVAAALFVLLRTDTLTLPVTFYGTISQR
jgi:triphosphoribosyl-dephospho-CoA synthase